VASGVGKMYVNRLEVTKHQHTTVNREGRPQSVNLGPHGKYFTCTNFTRVANIENFVSLENKYSYDM